MTHKSIDALLASTMFLLFVFTTPNYNQIAAKFGVINNANALTVAEIRAVRLEALNTASTTTATTTTTATITPTATITESAPTATVSTSGDSSVTESVVSPSVTVITPNGGETLQKGQTYRIKWESKGASDFYVYLLKDGTFYDGNSLSSSSNGYFDWTIPTSIPDGSNYKIEVSQGKGDPDQASDQSDAPFKITSPLVANSCANWQVTEGGPQGGIYWEHLRDFSKHPEIDQYQIQWFNGNWSPWYTPTVDDMDTKVNNDGSWRYLISYKQDHNWKTRECVSTVKFIDENQATLTLSKGAPGISLYKRKFIATGDVYIYRAEFLPRVAFKEAGTNTLRLYLNGAILANFYGNTSNGGISFDLPGVTRVQQGENTIELIGDLSNYTGGQKFEFDNKFAFAKDVDAQFPIDAEGLPATGHVTVIEQKKACTTWKVTSGGPQGGIYWEHLRDFSKHPEIDEYRIQWFNGNWSPWYVPTVGDLDTKVNNDGSWRYLISYKQDHNWETRDCVDGVVQQQNPSITVVTPTGRETYAPGQQINITWSYKDINDSKTVNMSMLNQNTGESVYIGKATISNKSFTYTIPANISLGKYKLITGVLSDDLRWDLALDWSDQAFSIVKQGSTGTITVVSPNGGESFTTGQNIDLRWKSTDLAPDAQVRALVVYSNKQQGTGASIVVTGSGNGWTNNDGQETITIPDLGVWGNLQTKAGTYFDIYIESKEYSSIYDRSDSLFTINSAIKDKKTLEVKPQIKPIPAENIEVKPIPVKTIDVSQTTTTTTESSGDTVTFARRLVVGKKGDDVMLLQEILIDEGFLKAYSPSGFYGQMTYRAVQKLQRANKIQPTGVVGPATRVLLNSIVDEMNVDGND